jgi:hypothetical protein
VPFSARRVDLPTPDFGFGTDTAAGTSSTKAEDGLTKNDSTAESNGNDDSSATDEATKTETDETPVVSAKKRRLNAKFTGDTIVARKDVDIRGHTAFLTFASKFFD